MTVDRIDDVAGTYVDDLYGLYQDWWWTEDRDRDDLPGMLADSDEVVAYVDSASDELVAFARVLSDYTYKALVFDVIVAESHRGTGLGKRLLADVLDHPDLADVEHVELYCVEEMVPFYERWGFTDDLGELRLMRLDRTDG